MHTVYRLIVRLELGLKPTQQNTAARIVSEISCNIVSRSLRVEIFNAVTKPKHTLISMHDNIMMSHDVVGLTN